MLLERLGVERATSALSVRGSKRNPSPGARVQMGAGLVLGLACAGSVMASPIMPSNPAYFPIGVFYQPANPVATTSFAGWKARGINTLIGYETQGYPAAGGISITAYTQAADNAGLYLIRQPNGDGTADTDPNVIAWLQPDEPDLKGILPSTLQATYNQLQAANATLMANGSLSAPRPVLMNFAGGYMAAGYAGLGWAPWAASPLGSQMTNKQYVQTAAQAADWVAQDIYPVTGFNQPNNLGVVGATTATLTSWTNKPGIAYIETSNQRLFANSNPELYERGPTPSEVRAEIWDAIIHGASGIAYFPQEINGFRYDATPVDVAAEMTKQDTIITGMARALNSNDAPDVTTVNFDNSSVEYTTRSYNGVTYLIALNLSNQPITTTFTANFSGPLSVLSSGLPLLGLNNTYTDNFDAYGVNIYAEGGSVTSFLAIPEPSSLVGLLAMPLLLRRRPRKSRSVSSDSLTSIA